MNEQELLLKINEALDSSDSSLKAAKRWTQKLAQKLGFESEILQSRAKDPHKELLGDDDLEENTSGKIIEGIFDGQNMMDKEENIYPVPANYASKSKLVEGDRLKLTIAENGSFIYKQIELIPRKLIVGHLVLDGSQYQVLSESKVFNVLYASVTFFRAKVGDSVTIIIPEENTSKWAAIENIIHSKTENLETL